MIVNNGYGVLETECPKGFDKDNHEACMECGYFEPCPCGECMYGMCVLDHKFHKADGWCF